MKNKRSLIGIALLVVSACFITIGVTREEALTVFVRAVHICLECIGLG